MESKSYLKSKTIWFNVFVAVFSVLSTNIELLESHLSGQNYLFLMMLISGVNVYLRGITSAGITK